MNKKICILDYGSGNIASVYNAIKSLNFLVVISNKKKDISESSHIILPGVGSFNLAMKKINKRLPVDFIKNQVINKSKPFLGICVGMQVLAEYGYENEKTEGLNWVPGHVDLIKTQKLNLPHVGWNNLLKKNNSKILHNYKKEDDVYFLHSYIFKPKNLKNVIAICNYGEKFPAIIQNKNIFGFQFHPEKSQNVGMNLLNNFINYF
jgi:glutamine amidotransferase